MRLIHAEIRDRILTSIADVVDESTFINGPAVATFEASFARYVGAPACVGMSSGLDALRLGLIASGIDTGCEVIVPAHTFVATLEAVTQAGAKPVIVDVSEADFCLDPSAAHSAINEATAAIVPVHLYGQLADMRALVQLSERHGLAVIEDACQAHGAARDGIRAGAAGRAAAFSFYPGKNLGAFGDAGALVTSDNALADRARALREHGQVSKYLHSFEGFTARLDTIQAVVLEHKLPLLDGWNAQRRSAATLYLEALDGVGDLVLPTVAEGSEPVWHLFVIRTADPTALAAHLRERGIGTGRHYPSAVHLTEAYAGLGHAPGAFPVAEKIAREVLSLPMYPGLGEGQIGQVVESIKEYFVG